MSTEFGGMFDAIFGLTLIGMIVGLAIPVAIVVVIVWAIRRGTPRPP